MSADRSEAESLISVNIRLAEYSALRAEILKRFEIQFQLVSLAVIAAGTIFIAGIQSSDHRVGAVLTLGYPILALFLATAWGHNDRRVWQLGTYIREHIETALGVDRLGWEHHHVAATLGPRYVLHAMKGVFLGTEVFAIATGLFLAKADPGAVVQALTGARPLPALDPFVTALFVLALATIPATLYALRRAPKKQRLIPATAVA